MAHLLRLVGRQSTKVVTRAICTTAAKPQGQLAALDQHGKDEFYPKLGNRDIVGFGINGMPEYSTRLDNPCPAIRFGENTAEVMALREKEKGDWKSLTLEEKKALYRHSFQLTYAEQLAPTGEWKNVLAIFLLGLAVTGWFMIYLKLYVYPPLPPTITKEWQEICLDRMIDLGSGRVEGVASMYDYEKNQWKK